MMNSSRSFLCSCSSPVLVTSSMVFACVADAVARHRAFFGEGSGTIHFDDVACAGTEFRLTDCTRRNIGHNCEHSEDAAVTCNATSEFVYDSMQSLQHAAHCTCNNYRQYYGHSDFFCCFFGGRGGTEFFLSHDKRFVKMETFACQALAGHTPSVRGGWRSAGMRHGALFVTVSGAAPMLRWPAGSWDSEQKVRWNNLRS